MRGGSYIDARLLFDRLDHVCGERLSARFDELSEMLTPQPVDRNGVVREPPPVYVRCRLTLYGVTREDVGEGQDPKAAFSDDEGGAAGIAARERAQGARDGLEREAWTKRKR